MKKLIQICIIIIIGYWLFTKFLKPISDRHSLYKVRKNYGEQVDKICQTRKLSSAFFKALIILESSADERPKSRFEKHVFERLKQVQAGKRKKFTGLYQKDLRKYSDSELKMLATSWGPFQIMGYHSIRMGINVDDLRGKNAVKYGIQWCEENYGRYLRNHQFRDAFHIHNTGRPFPKHLIPQTHDPAYVFKGLAFMQQLK